MSFKAATKMNKFAKFAIKVKTTKLAKHCENTRFETRFHLSMLQNAQFCKFCKKWQNYKNIKFCRVLLKFAVFACFAIACI